MEVTLFHETARSHLVKLLVRISSFDVDYSSTFANLAVMNDHNENEVRMLACFYSILNGLIVLVLSTGCTSPVELKTKNLFAQSSS